MKPLEEIKKNLGKEKLLLGQNQTLKNLRIGKVEKVFLASNCDAKVRRDIGYYCELNGTPVTQLSVPNDELGIICKKQFPISIISLLK